MILLSARRQRGVSLLETNSRATYKAFCAFVVRRTDSQRACHGVAVTVSGYTESLINSKVDFMTVFGEVQLNTDKVVSGRFYPAGNISKLVERVFTVVELTVRQIVDFGYGCSSCVKDVQLGFTCYLTQGRNGITLEFG